MASQSNEKIDLDFVALATEFLQMVSNELDPYTTTQGVITDKGGTEVVLFTPSHIQFAKYGRGPGEKPPLDPILKWVKDKGIVGGDEELGTAFAILNSIAQNGTKNYVANAPNALDEAIDANFEAYNKRMGDAMAVEVEQEVLAFYEKMFPPTKTFKI